MHRYEIAPGACQTCLNVLYPLNNCCDFSVMGGWLEGDLARVLDQRSTVADGIGGSPAAITNKNGKSGNRMSMKRDNFQHARPRRFRRLQHPTSIDNATTARSVSVADLAIYKYINGRLLREKCVQAFPTQSRRPVGLNRNWSYLTIAKSRIGIMREAQILAEQAHARSERLRPSMPLALALWHIATLAQ